MGKTVKLLGRTLGGLVGGFITGGVDNAIASIPYSLALATGNFVNFGLMATADAAQTYGIIGGKGRKANGSTPGVFRQSVSDSFIVYGKRRVGGLLVFFHPRKVGKDHYRYFVIACAGHRCQGVTKWFLGEEEVTVDGAGKVTSGKYANNAWLWFQRGLASETANATFVSECGGKWTADHKGNGVAAIYAKFKMTDEVVEAGHPNITAEIEGRDEIYDPRDESTGYTNNAALVTYDWLQIPREEGGFGASADEIPDEDYISAQANVSDEEVDGEARYAIDAVIATGAAPSEVRDELVKNCAGTFTYSGGKFLIRVGYYVPPVETLLETDLAGPIEISPLIPGDEDYNEVQGTFVDPASGYQTMPFQTQQLTPDPDDIRQGDLELAFITSKTRAERIARIVLNRGQAGLTVSWPMNIAGLKVAAMDNVQLDTERYSLSDYVFTIVTWSLAFDPEAGPSIQIALRQESEDIYEPPTPVEADAVPVIEVAEPIELERDAALLIANSWTEPTRVLTSSESGGTATVTVIEHDRVYPDGRRVTIPEETFTGLITDTGYFGYYVDLTRSDTAPTIVLTDDPNEPAAEVGSHDLGRVKTPIAASGITYEGGGSYPAGGTIGREMDPTL